MPDRTFLLRRLHSLTGVVPLGGFLLFHFFENARARSSPEAFNQVVVNISNLPYIFFLEIFFLLLPLTFHALYGLFIRTPSRPNVGNYGTARNWAYLFQRITGVIAFFYIIFHVVTTRGWALFVKGDHITWHDMNMYVSTPWVTLFYMLGIVSVCFHFCNGLWSFAVTWGLVTSQRGMDMLAKATMVFFIGLTIVGLDIFSAFLFPGGVLNKLLEMM